MTLIDKVKALFLSEEVAAQTEQKFLDAKLVDGTIVRVAGEEFKVGDALQVITESGEVVNAPEGMHELENGDVLVVDAEGKITEFRKLEAEAEMKEEVPVEEKMAEEEVVIEEEAAKCPLEERMLRLEEAVATLIEGLALKKAELKAVINENDTLKIENQELSKVPAASPVKTKKFEKLLSSTESTSSKKVNTNLLSKIENIRNKN